jgi:hypothetical protein
MITDNNSAPVEKDLEATTQSSVLIEHDEVEDNVFNTSTENEVASIEEVTTVSGVNEHVEDDPDYESTSETAEAGQIDNSSEDTKAVTSGPNKDSKNGVEATSVQSSGLSEASWSNKLAESEKAITSGSSNGLAEAVDSDNGPVENVEAGPADGPATMMMNMMPELRPVPREQLLSMPDTVRRAILRQKDTIKEDRDEAVEDNATSEEDR